MNLLSLFRSKRDSAPVARERLQGLLWHERAMTGKWELMATLQEGILAVIAKHVSVEREKVQVKLDRGDKFSMLEIDVEVPSLLKKKAEAEAAKAAQAAEAARA
jgi:cell division topological specificity factor